MTAIQTVVEEVKEAMCDKYCKYPFEIADEEALRIVCNRCPLNRLEPGVEFKKIAPEHWDAITAPLNGDDE